jgi:hypothetical protein
MEITQVEVFKDGELVAVCKESIRSVDVKIDGLPPLTAYSLPRVELERIRVFEHLNGRPLSAFFNEAGARITSSGPNVEDKSEVEPVFYIHGRSETMRGKTTVSAVILVHFRCEAVDLPSSRELLPQLPAIYKEISLRL